MLLKWFCSKLNRNIFSGSPSILVSEKSHHMRGSFLLNWVKILGGGETRKSFLTEWFYFRVRKNIFSGSRSISASEKSHNRCLVGSFLLNRVKISLISKSINGAAGPKNVFVTEMILPQDQKKHIFWKSVETCQWKEPPGVSDRVVLIEWSENITDFEVYKWGSSK